MSLARFGRLLTQMGSSQLGKLGSFQIDHESTRGRRLDLAGGAVTNEEVARVAQPHRRGEVLEVARARLEQALAPLPAWRGPGGRRPGEREEQLEAVLLGDRHEVVVGVPGACGICLRKAGSGGGKARPPLAGAAGGYVLPEDRHTQAVDSDGLEEVDPLLELVRADPEHLGVILENHFLGHRGVGGGAAANQAIAATKAVRVKLAAAVRRRFRVREMPMLLRGLLGLPACGRSLPRQP